MITKITQKTTKKKENKKTLFIKCFFYAYSLSIALANKNPQEKEIIQVIIENTFNLKLSISRIKITKEDRTKPNIAKYNLTSYLSKINLNNFDISKTPINNPIININKTMKLLKLNILEKALITLS